MVKGHHLQLRCKPPLFYNFSCYHQDPIIQKEVDGLLAKGAIEPLAGHVGFFSNIFVVAKHTGGL